MKHLLAIATLAALCVGCNQTTISPTQESKMVETGNGGMLILITNGDHIFATFTISHGAAMVEIKEEK